MPFVATPEVELVGLDVSRGTSVYGLKGHFQPLRDRLSNFVLDLEDVGELPIVSLRPEVKPRLRIDELHGDPQPISRAPHAALQNRRHAKSLCNLGDARPLVLERERGTAGGYVQLGYLAQSIQNVLGK